MMGFNHRLVTGSFVFAFTGSFFATAIACSGATFPDRIERIIPISHNKIHRTISHWFPIYLIPILLIYYFLTTSGVFLLNNNQWFSLMSNGINNMVIKTIGANFTFWCLVGCLAHIIEDSICGKIPIINPTKPKVHFRLFYTNAPFEYIFSFCVSMLVLIAKVPTFAIFVKSSLIKIMQ